MYIDVYPIACDDIPLTFGSPFSVLLSMRHPRVALRAAHPSGSPPGADELLPLLILTIQIAKPTCLHSCILYMQVCMWVCMLNKWPHSIAYCLCIVVYVSCLTFPSKFIYQCYVTTNKCVAVSSGTRASHN